MFESDFSNQAKRFLKNCDKITAERILAKIKLLRNEPVPHGAVSIVGEKRTFRIRVGDYRVVYEIKWENNFILVAIIGKRSRVYS